SRQVHRCESRKSDRFRYVVVNRLHAAAHKVGFVPKAGASGVAQKLLPPQHVRLGARPTLERVKIAPVLAHARVQRKKGIDDVLVQQQALGLLSHGVRNARPKPQDGLDSCKRVDPHSQIDHDQIGIAAKIDSSAIDSHPLLRSLPPPTKWTISNRSPSESGVFVQRSREIKSRFSSTATRSGLRPSCPMRSDKAARAPNSRSSPLMMSFILMFEPGQPPSHITTDSNAHFAGRLPPRFQTLQRGGPTAEYLLCCHPRGRGLSPSTQCARPRE